jgi:hypothetical protein
VLRAVVVPTASIDAVHCFSVPALWFCTPLDNLERRRAARLTLQFLTGIRRCLADQGILLKPLSNGQSAAVVSHLPFASRSDSDQKRHNCLRLQLSTSPYAAA